MELAQLTFHCFKL